MYWVAQVVKDMEFAGLVAALLDPRREDDFRVTVVVQVGHDGLRVKRSKPSAEGR